MDIPPNFDEPWPLFDVILIADNADGRLLYANKAVPATFLKYFRGLFFSGFQEKEADSVNVSCDYDALKEILRIIYQVNREFIKRSQRFELNLLTKIYEAADYLDSSLIRKMCADQLLDAPSVETATAAFKLDLRDTLIEMLRKMSLEDGKKFLEIEDTRLLFSKNDVALIYENISKKKFPQYQTLYPSFYSEGLPDLSNSVNPLIDLTQRWPRSDVLIKTKNSEGKELFSNKMVLSTVSPHFEDLFFESQASADSPDLTEIDVDVDYIIMKNILSIIHHSVKKGFVSILSEEHVVIYMIFCAASEGNLNIPSIRDACETSLLYDPDNAHLDVSVKLNLDETKTTLLTEITADELLEWIYNSAEETDPVVTVEEGKYEIGYTDRGRNILSLNDVRIIVERILKEYNE